MKEPRHDDERLAALLEGRLEGPERDELLAYLATADEDFHVFAKTAAVLREMEEEQATQDHQAGEQVELPPPVRGAVPPSAKSGYRRWKALRVTVPSVLVGLLALTTFTTTRAASLGSPIAVAQRLEPARLSEGWTDKRPWTEVRGEDPARPQEQQAAQVGALLVDLAVSIQAEDAPMIQVLAGDLHQTAAEPDAPGNPIIQIRNRSGEPRTVLRPLLKDATEHLEERLNRDYLRLGGWTEAALLAASSRDADFFRSRAARAALTRAGQITGDNQPAQEAIAAIRAQVDAGRIPASADLERLMKALVG